MPHPQRIRGSLVSVHAGSTTGLGAIIALKSEGATSSSVVVLTAGWGTTSQGFRLSFLDSGSPQVDSQVVFTPTDHAYSLLRATVSHSAQHPQALPFVDLGLHDQKKYIVVTPGGETKLRLKKVTSPSRGWVIEVHGPSPALVKGAPVFTQGQILVGVEGANGEVVPNWRVMADIHTNPQVLEALRTYTFATHASLQVENVPLKALETLVERASAGFESHTNLLSLVKGHSFFQVFSFFTKPSLPLLDTMLEMSLFFYGTNRPELEANPGELGYGLSSSAPHSHAMRIGAQHPWEEIGKYLDAMQQRDLLLYTHGFNTDMTTLLETGLTLREKLKPGMAVLVFGWPSKGCIFDYQPDEEEEVKSVPAFTEFLRLASQFQVSRDGELNILLHSLGNKLFLKSCESLTKESMKFNKVVLAAADVAASEAPPLLKQVVGMAKEVTVVTNKEDWGLFASETLYHKGEGKRLGQEETYHQEGVRVIPIGNEGGLVGHSYDTSDLVVGLF